MHLLCLAAELSQRLSMQHEQLGRTQTPKGLATLPAPPFMDSTWPFPELAELRP